MLNLMITLAYPVYIFRNIEKEWGSGDLLLLHIVFLVCSVLIFSMRLSLMSVSSAVVNHIPHTNSTPFVFAISLH